MADVGIATAHPDGDRNKAALLNTVTWIEAGIAIVVLAARLITRTKIIQTLGWDDAFMVLAMALALTSSGLLAASTTYGFGRHMFYLSVEDEIMAMKLHWLSQGFHVMSTNFGKVSIGVFLVQVIGGKKKTQKIIVYAFMVLLTIINSVSIYTIYGQCSPSNALWDYRVESTCWPPHLHRNSAFAQGSFSAFSDGVLAIYPAFIIWNLHLPKKVKLGLVSVLALGILAMVAAIVKTVYLADITARSDFTWDTIQLMIWTATEQYLIVIAACIPTLGPLLKIAMGKPPTARSGNSYGQNTYSGASRRISGRPPPPMGSKSGLDFTWTRVSRGRSRGRGGSGDSEQGMVQHNEERGRHGINIVKTTEFQVNSFDDKEDGSGTGHMPWEPSNRV